MTPLRYAAALLVGLLVVTTVVLAGPGLLGPASADPAEPTLVDVVASGGECATGAPLLAVDRGDAADGTTVRITADVEVPNPSYTVSPDRFERVDDTTYALYVVILFRAA